MSASPHPRIVGRYALFDVIASGGMASVHIGRLMGPVGFSRTVAIKRLHEAYASDPEFVAMFLDEARLVARIRHPNVVPTLDVVALEHELLLVMEYVVGAPLAALTRRCVQQDEAVPVSLAVDILVNVLNGLHAAHEATNEDGQPLNIVHRDVSPQNVLVGVDGIARVLDFGVAKAVGRMHQTRDGQLKGKLRYMPPEYLRGNGASRVADVYAAAAVLWETLTARRLFDGEDDATVMYQVLEGKVVPPSRWREGLSPELDGVVLKGLSRDPRDRFETAKEFGAALEQVAPAVRRREVGEWVARIAGDYIQERQQSVARVESANAPLRPASQPPPKALGRTLVERLSESGSTLRAASAVSRPASLPVSTRRRGERGRQRSAALATVVLLAGTVWFLFGNNVASSSASELVRAGVVSHISARLRADVEGAGAWSRLPASEFELSALQSQPAQAVTEQPQPVRRKTVRGTAKKRKAEQIYSRD